MNENVHSDFNIKNLRNAVILCMFKITFFLRAILFDKILMEKTDSNKLFQENARFFWTFKLYDIETLLYFVRTLMTLILTLKLSPFSQYQERSKNITY